MSYFSGNCGVNCGDDRAAHLNFVPFSKVICSFFYIRIYFICRNVVNIMKHQRALNCYRTLQNMADVYSSILNAVSLEWWASCISCFFLPKERDLALLKYKEKLREEVFVCVCVRRQEE